MNKVFTFLCIFILISISFSNFESDAATIDVTVVDVSSNFVRVMVDIYGYTPNDKRVHVEIESSDGQLVKQTDLNVKEKSDVVWGAEMSFISNSRHGSNYNVFVYNEDGKFLGSTSFSLTSTPNQPPIQGITTGMSYSISPNKLSFERGEVIKITLEHGIQSGKFAITTDIIDPRGEDIFEMEPITLEPGDELEYELDTNLKSYFPTTGKYILRLMLAGEVLDIPITIQSAVSPTPEPEPTPPPIPPAPPTPPPSSSNAGFPMEYVIAGIVIVVIVVGIGIALSKRKKTAPIAVQSPGKVHVTSPSDDTQFWVCPRCGRDIQMKSGRQFCSSCNVYL